MTIRPIVSDRLFLRDLHFSLVPSLVVFIGFFKLNVLGLRFFTAAFKRFFGFQTAA